MKEDWVECRLPEICNIQTGKYDANHAKENGKYRFYTCAFDYLMCDTNRFKGESIILPGNGANVGEVFYYNGEFDAYQRTYVINDILIYSKFVYYHLHGFWKLLNLEKQYGTATNYIRIGNFNDYPIPLPPLPIQRAIVSKIETLFISLDKGIADLKTAQEQLKIYRQAVLKKAFEGELTRKWREERALSENKLPTADELLEEIKLERITYYENQLKEWEADVKKWEKNGKKGSKPGKPKILDEISINENSSSIFPKYWLPLKMKFICTHITDGDHQPPPKSVKGIPFITISNVKDNKIDFSDTFFVDEKYFNSIPKYKIPIYGDILYTVTGSFGIPILIDFNKKFCFQRHIGLIRPLNFILNKWIYYLLSSILIYSQAQETATGTAQKTVSLNSMRNFNVLFPSLPEQNQIVLEIEKRLSVCDKLEESISESLEKAKALRQSILKKAFDGKLLTPNEVEACKREKDYEPASELLKKIKLEKENIV